MTEIKVCGKFKEDKDVVKLVKRYKKRGYTFRGVSKEKGKTCISFEEPSKKESKMKGYMKRNLKRNIKRSLFRR